MSSHELARISAQIITKDFGLEESELTDVVSLDSLEARLTQIVQYLLDKDFQRLINIMYRIDLSESTFKHTLANADPDILASSLAEQILKRELQKAELRKKYS